MFILSNRVLAAVEQKAYDDVNRRLASKVARLFEEKMSSLSGDEVIKYVIERREICFQAGVYTERGIAGLIFIELLFGDKFLNDYILTLLQEEANGDEIINTFFESLVISAE